MNKNILWGIILILLIINGLTLTLWKKQQEEVIQTSTTKIEEKIDNSDKQVVIARVGDRNIFQQELMERLLSLYGSDVLKEMINQEVVFQMAQRNNIDISDKELQVEIDFLKANSSDQIDSISLTNEDEWKKEIKYLMLLEKLITKDVVISEEELLTFYNDNQELYSIPTTYQLSHIVVGSIEEANSVIEELENGSDFSTLAMERSEDVFTASQGGNLGYIREDSGFVPDEYIEQVQNLKVGSWSKKPIKTKDGYSVLFLNDVINQKSYRFNDVKDQIRRQLAMQQTDGTLTPDTFWPQIGVEIIKETN